MGLLLPRADPEYFLTLQSQRDLCQGAVVRQSGPHQNQGSSSNLPVLEETDVNTSGDYKNFTGVFKTLSFKEKYIKIYPILNYQFFNLYFKFYFTVVTKLYIKIVHCEHQDPAILIHFVSLPG